MTYFNYSSKLETRIKSFTSFLANAKVSPKQYSQVLNQIIQLKTELDYLNTLKINQLRQRVKVNYITIESKTI